MAWRRESGVSASKLLASPLASTPCCSFAIASSRVMSLPLASTPCKYLSKPSMRRGPQPLYETWALEVAGSNPADPIPFQYVLCCPSSANGLCGERQILFEGSIRQMPHTYQTLAVLHRNGS